MEKVVVSRLEIEDIVPASKLIQILHEKIIDVRKDIFLPKQENWEEYLESKIENEDYVLLVARIQDKVIGVCTAEIKHCGDGVETCIRDILFIDYIAVAEEYRRSKIGTKLLDEIKKIAKKENISTVELNVWGFNSDAIKFYESNEMKPKRIVYEYLINKDKEKKL